MSLFFWGEFADSSLLSDVLLLFRCFFSFFGFSASLLFPCFFCFSAILLTYLFSVFVASLLFCLFYASLFLLLCSSLFWFSCFPNAQRRVLLWGSAGWLSLDAAFASATVCNRWQPCAIVRTRLRATVTWLWSLLEVSNVA